MKRYVGRWTEQGGLVMVEEGRARFALPLRLDLYNHSPTGFAWGYRGSGPAQLALALVADATADDRLALLVHQRVKELFVACIEETCPWDIDDQTIKDLVGLIMRGEEGMGS